MGFFLRRILLLVSFTMMLSLASALEDCPFGLINDTYPGECGRYIDTNSNSICDRSEVSPETDLQNATSNLSQASLNANNLFQGLDLPQDQTQLAQPSQGKLKAKYDFLEISGGLLVLYSATFILSRKKTISLVLHRRLWNALLLASFLVSGIFGVILTVRISYGWIIPLPFDMLYWHVEFGVALVAISTFHILWHWAYFKNVLNFKRKE